MTHRRTLIKRRILLTTIAALAMLAALPSSIRADEIALFNFNDSNTIVDRGTGTLVTPLNISFVSGTTVNAQMGDPAGQTLNITGGTNNQGSTLTLMTSTIGFNNITVSFATQRTLTGFSSLQFQSSTDGVTFTNVGAAFDPTTSFIPITFSFSDAFGVANNALTAFRLIFSGATGPTGAARIDNLLVAGTPQAPVAAVPEPASMLLLGTGLAGIAVAGLRRRSHNCSR